MDLDWNEIVKLIEYNFDSIGACSGVDYEHPKYGELHFLWNGNKSTLEIIFVDTCHNCICDEDPIMCDCDWIGFKETDWKHKSFTKKEVLNIKIQNTLF